MAEKAKTTKQNKKTGLIIGICIAVIVIIAIAVTATVLIINNNKGLSDSYFVSDDTKLVINYESDDLIEDEDGVKPNKVHVVYDYSGDQITGITAYYQYTDKETAEKAFTKFKSSNQDLFKEIKLDGTTMIATYPESDFTGLSTSDVKQQIEVIESIKNSNVESQIEIDDSTSTETTEPTESITE